MKVSRLARCTLAIAAIAAIAAGSIATLDAPVSAAPILVAPLPVARPDLVVSSVSTVSVDLSGPYQLMEGSPKYIKTGNTIDVRHGRQRRARRELGHDRMGGHPGPAVVDRERARLHPGDGAPHLGVELRGVRPAEPLRGQPLRRLQLRQPLGLLGAHRAPGNNEISSANNWGYGNDWTMVY